MLLQRLAEFAQANDDGVPPFYARKPVRWALALNPDGSALTGQLRDLADPTDPQRRRGVARLVPAITKTSGIAPSLGVDTLEYVFGWVGEDSKAERVARQHEAFLALAEQWAAADTDGPARAIVAFYRNGHAEQVQRPDDWSRDQLVAFQVDGEFAAESASAIRFWSTVAESRKGAGVTGMCLVCGQVRPLLKTIPQQVAKRWLPGAANSASLVSVNQATHGYELQTSLSNTPICGDCGLKFMGGLDTLLSSERHSVSFSGQGSRFVWWLVGPATFDPIRLLNQPPDPAEAGELLRSAHRGAMAGLDDPTVFCSMTVSGNVARVVVRDWVEMPLASAKDNLLAWFADLEVVDAWTGATTRLGLTDLVRASGRFERGTKQWARLGASGEDRPDDLLRGLMRAALFKTPLPPRLLSHVIRRIRADGRVDTARAALIRLGLRRHPTTVQGAIMSHLDLDSCRPAYVSGRIFAVMDELQRTVYRAANQPLNTGFSERYFGRAIANPRAVLTRNRPTVEAWLRRLRGPLRKPAVAAAYLRRLDELYELIPAESGVPTAASLTEQGDFVLGYHHQRAHMRAEASAARAAAASDLPTADPDETNSEGAAT
jgi:CRISPR-associated protein Csd1